MKKIRFLKAFNWEEVEIHKLWNLNFMFRSWKAKLEIQNLNMGVSNRIWNIELELKNFSFGVSKLNLKYRIWKANLNFAVSKLNLKSELKYWSFNGNKQSFWFSNWDEKIRIKIGWNLDSISAFNLLIIGWKSIIKENEIS